MRKEVGGRLAFVWAGNCIMLTSADEAWLRRHETSRLECGDNTLRDFLYDWGYFLYRQFLSYPGYWQTNGMHTVSLVIVIYFVHFSSRISNGHDDNKRYSLWICQWMSCLYYEYYEYFSHGILTVITIIFNFFLFLIYNGLICFQKKISALYIQQKNL